MADQYPFPHSQNYAFRKSCKICEMSFTNQGDLNNHIASTHFMSRSTNVHTEPMAGLRSDGSPRRTKQKKTKQKKTKPSLPTATTHAERPSEYLDLTTATPATTYDAIRGFTEPEITSPPLRPARIEYSDPTTQAYNDKWFPEPEQFPEPQLASHLVRLLNKSMPVDKKIKRLQAMLGVRMRGYDKMHGRNTECKTCECQIKPGQNHYKSDQHLLNHGEVVRVLTQLRYGTG